MDCKRSLHITFKNIATSFCNFIYFIFCFNGRDILHYHGKLGDALFQLIEKYRVQMYA